MLSNYVTLVNLCTRKVAVIPLCTVHVIMYVGHRSPLFSPTQKCCFIQINQARLGYTRSQTPPSFPYCKRRKAEQGLGTRLRLGLVVLDMTTMSESLL